MKKICCFCKKEIEGFGNNALPLKNGRCCDKCNFQKVIPERIKDIFDDKEMKGGNENG